jgi:hypothetical protein
MRPDPSQDRDQSASGRIIYLGLVRRRRVARGAPDHHYLAAVALLGIAAWAVWLTILFTLSPARLLTYLAFFVPLGIALASTGTMIAYGVDARSERFASLARAARRGTLVAAVAVANLAFIAGHRWTPIAGILSLGIAAVIEAIGAHRSDWD